MKKKEYYKLEKKDENIELVKKNKANSNQLYLSNVVLYGIKNKNELFDYICENIIDIDYLTPLNALYSIKIIKKKEYIPYFYKLITETNEYYIDLSEI